MRKKRGPPNKITRERIGLSLRERQLDGLHIGRPRTLEGPDGRPNDLGLQVLALYGQHNSMRDIEKQTGVPKSTIGRFLQRHQ